MTTLFERLRDGTGLRLLTSYGESFVISKKVIGAFTPATGETTSSTVTQTVKGKMFSLDKDFDVPELAEAATSEIYISASGITFVPAPGCTVYEEATSEKYTVVKVRPIPESGAVVIYRLLVNK